MAFRLSERAIRSMRRFAATGCAILGAVLVEPAPGPGGPPGRLGSSGSLLRRVLPEAPIGALATISNLEATEVAKLTATDADELDHLGSSVAIDGDTLIAGAFRDSHDSAINAGSAYVFVRDSGSAGAWEQVAKLIGSDTASCDYFGFSVGISGDTAVVGARHNDPGGLSEAGAAYIFMRDQGGADAWGQVAKLTAGDAEPGDSFGVSVAISGDTVVVGSALDDHDGTYHAGSAYVFMRDQGGPDAWGEAAKLTASDGENEDRFGVSVTIDGTTVAIGASGDDHSGVQNPGSLYLFELAHPSIPFFSDGFESGNTSAWSATIP